MKVNSIIFSVIATLTLATSLFFLNPLSLNGNPDYICTKKINGASCELYSESKCSEWQKGDGQGYRICTGRTPTEVYYYRTRTTCEGNRETSRGGGYKYGDSGRKTTDMYHYDYSCKIKEVDNGAPAMEKIVE